MIGFDKLHSFIIRAILCCLLAVLASCYAPSEKPKTELKFWTMQLQPEFTPYFAQLITRFEKLNPALKVDWVDIPWDAMESKILSAVSSNTAPDVVNLNPNFASLLAARGAWLNLNSHLSPKTIQQYLPKIWQASSLNELTFGLPWYLTTQITLYNQEIFQQASVTSIPSTYQDMAVFAETIKETTGKYAFFMTFVPNDSAEVLESLVQMGVQLFDAQGKAAFNSPSGLAAFNYWVTLYQKGLLPPEVLTQGHRHAVELYQSGQLALLSTGAEFF